MQRAEGHGAPLPGFLDSISSAVQPVLPTPSRRGQCAVPPNFTPRRSIRIAKSDRGLDSETKAKRVLLLRLGLLKDDESVSDAILDRYYKLFERPLATEVVCAFADFYGWRLPQAVIDGLAPPNQSCQLST